MLQYLDIDWFWFYAKEMKFSCFFIFWSILKLLSFTYTFQMKIFLSPFPHYTSRLSYSYHSSILPSWSSINLAKFGMLAPSEKFLSVVWVFWTCFLKLARNILEPLALILFRSFFYKVRPGDGFLRITGQTWCF